MAFDGNVIKRFSPDDNSLGGIENTISFSFRTFNGRGTILYYINTAATDYIAIELRNGVPWFFFDAGSGPAVVRPDLAGEANVVFNDGAWHSVTAAQTSRIGSIVVDGVYTGTGQSSGTDQVISSRQALHVGGIPGDAPRSSILGLGSPDSTLEGRSFAGCLFGLTLNNQVVNFEVGTNLGDDLIQDIPGCPIDLEPGFSFLGGGYIGFPPNILHNETFSWTFDIRTTHSMGVVFFAHAPDQSAVALELRASVLSLVLASGTSTQVMAIGDNSTCDGLWHSVLIDKSLGEVFASVDGIGGSLFLPSAEVIFSSSAFIGGMATDSEAYDIARRAGVNVYAPFSGCARSGGLVVGGVPSLALTPTSHPLVRLDGCYAGSSVSARTACEDPWVSLTAGTDMQLTDEDLGAWTGKH